MKAHAARLTTIHRVIERGWSWGVEPRRKFAPALISPRGTVFVFRSGCLVRYRDHFELEESA